MSIAAISAVTQDEVARLRQSHPGAFSTPAKALRRWAPLVLAVVYVIGSMWYFEFGRLLEASERVLRLLRAFVVWRDMETWSYAQIYVGIAQTLAMAFLGTLLGTIGALGVGFLAARNIMPVMLVRQAVRRILDILRGIDQLVWGLVFVRAVGLGPLAGVLAIFVSDLGTLAKLYSEAIENIDRKQVEGVRATGAGPLAVIRYGYIPQVLPVFISQSLYFLESNTRSATILGIVGAGGIGMIIIERFRASLYDQVAFVVLNVLVLIFAIDWLSKRVRLWAIGEQHHG
jgi:phosphonate transport system permease protein